MLSSTKTESVPYKSTVHLINMYKTISYINTKLPELKDNYYMILNVALSVVLDIEFMSKSEHEYREKPEDPDDPEDHVEPVKPKEPINPEDPEEHIDPDVTNIYDVVSSIRLRVLFKKMKYHPGEGFNQMFDMNELSVIRNMISLFYEDINDYNEYVKNYTNEYNQHKINIDSIGSKESIWDAKNYSLITFYNILYITLNKIKPPEEYFWIGIYNLDIIRSGHVIYIQKYYDYNNYFYYLEAVSIQQTFVGLLFASGSEVLSKKEKSEKESTDSYKISKNLFDHITGQNLYKNARYMYAYAWPKISNILVNFYGFTALVINLCLKTKESDCTTMDKMLKTINEEYYDISELNAKCDIFSNSPYILTFRKIKRSN